MIFCNHKFLIIEVSHEITLHEVTSHLSRMAGHTWDDCTKGNDKHEPQSFFVKQTPLEIASSSRHESWRYEGGGCIPVTCTADLLFCGKCYTMVW